MRQVVWFALFFLLGVFVATGIQSASATDPDCCAVLQERLESLEKRLALLESVIKVSGGSVSIQGTIITIKASGDLNLKASKINQN